MEQFIRKNDREQETQKEIIKFYQEEINKQSNKWEHSEATIRLIESQNSHKEYLIILEEVKQKLLLIMK